MYLKHFRLRDRPFKLTQDLNYYFSPPHQVPLNELCYSIEEEQGLALLIGAHGLGKTTVLKRLLASLPTNLGGLMMSDHSLGAESLVAELALMLRVREGGSPSTAISEHLRSQLVRGRKLVLILDEAQALTTHQLEEVRFLTNLDFNGRRLVEIVLAGPPSLRERLHKPQLDGLRQRIAVRSVVEPMTLEQTADYMWHRLRVAGAGHKIFDAGAVASIHEKSRGVPRLVNILCDRALITAFARAAIVVDADTVSAAEADLKRDEDNDIESGMNTNGDGPHLASSNGVTLDQVVERLERIEARQERILELLANELSPERVRGRGDR